MLRRPVFGIVLSLLACAGTAQATTELAYVAPTLAACSLDDLSMQTRSAALVAAGWQPTTNPDAVFLRFMSRAIWEDVPNPNRETDTVVAALVESHAFLVNEALLGLKDPSRTLAFLRPDDPTGALVLYRFGDDSPGSARSSCDMITGALDDALLQMAGLTDRPAIRQSSNSLYQKGAVVGDRIMATDTTIKISPPSYLLGSIELRAYTSLYTTTSAYDPAFLEAMLEDAE
jgi:hypothetical protein